MHSTAPERFNSFDASYVSKSGKHTPGVGWYWSGCAGKAKWGLEIVAFLVVDAYFSRKPFVDKVRECRVQLITRLRDDAVLYYPYLVPKHAGRGRHKVFGGRVDTRCLSEEHFSPCACDEHNCTAYEARVWIKGWPKRPFLHG